MWCPKCAGKTVVTSTDTSESVMRSRKCVKCNYSFMSVEVIFTDKYWSEYERYVSQMHSTKQREHPKQGVLSL